MLEVVISIIILVIGITNSNCLMLKNLQHLRHITQQYNDLELARQKAIEAQLQVITANNSLEHA